MYRAIAGALTADKANSIEVHSDCIAFHVGYFGRFLRIQYTLLNSITDGTVKLHEDCNSITATYETTHGQLLLIAIPIALVATALFPTTTPLGYYSIIIVPAAFAGLYLLQVFVGVFTLESIIKKAIKAALK